MCFQPISVRVGKPDEAIVPCNKCPACKKRRVSSWSFRLLQQYKKCKSAHFVTLTYDTQHVPITENGMMTLDFNDLQKFFKRLRKHETSRKCRYYAVGEYGTRNKRPHYHLILFNAEIDDVLRSWQLGGTPIGSSHFGSVTPQSVGYTLKYISKPKSVPRHARDDRKPERALISKGIGINYLTPRMVNWHTSNVSDGVYAILEGGKKIPLPRYYRDKLELSEELRELTQFHYLTHQRKREAQLVKRYGEIKADKIRQARIAAEWKKYYSTETRKKL